MPPVSGTGERGTVPFLTLEYLYLGGIGRMPNGGVTMTFRIHSKIGLHALDIVGRDDRWSVAVDGGTLRGRFRSQGEARSAGQAELDRIRTAASSAPRVRHGEGSLLGA